MVKFYNLLLNLFLILKNSNNKANVFMEVQEACGLPKLKLIKAVVTHWLSHGKAANRCPDRYEPLLVSLDKTYEKKKEPSVR